MLIIQRKSTDPYFNIAAEEYLLKQLNEDSFAIWQNEPAVIIGKHQNALAEINLELINKKKLPIVRRISGGGAVFHDMGNLNFSFIARAEEGKLVDFRKFTRPIIEVLKKLGIDAKFEGKNNLTIQGLKISGNAEHVFKNKVLHHGTLLFSSNLEMIDEILRPGHDNFTDKAVKSIRSEVTNISTFLKNPISITEFQDLILDHIRNNNNNVHNYSLSNDDRSNINKLVKAKYASWEWNFGYGPKYHFERKAHIDTKEIIISLDVEHGIIRHVSLNGDFFSLEMKQMLEGLLHDLPHQTDIIKSSLEDAAYLPHKQMHTFLKWLF